MQWYEAQCPTCELTVYWKESKRNPDPQPKTCQSKAYGGPECHGALPLFRPIKAARKQPVWTLCAADGCGVYFWTKNPNQRFCGHTCQQEEYRATMKREAVAAGLEAITQKYAPVPEQDAWIRQQAKAVRSGEIPIPVARRGPDGPC